jgi:hypothetical protein
MKVALLLSGHFRSYDKAYKTLEKNVLDICNPDIFISSEETIGYNNQTNGGRGDEHLIYVPLNIVNLEQLYHPKKILIEQRQKYSIQKYMHRLGHGSRGAEQMFGMFYGINKANQLKIEYEKENNFRYDVVIRCRPDLFFDSPLDRNELENSLHGGVYFPKFGNYSGLNDQFAFGNSSNMDLYARVYNNLDVHFNSGCIWHPEIMLKFNIDYYNIPIARSEIKYRILRANGNFFINEHSARGGDIL